MRKAVRAIVVRDGQLLVMHRNKFGHEYYTLLGGGIDPGEDGERALRRELFEESGYQLVGGRLVFIEEAGDPYGTQYIYLCEIAGTEPQLSPHSEEAQINALGQNLHKPMWLPLRDLATAPFRTTNLQQAILYGIAHGFPDQPVLLDNQYLGKVQANIAKKEV